MISSKTSLLGLIGNPVTHSLSPIMQNAAINHLKLDFVYLALPCEIKNFAAVLDALKRVNFKGLNITIPFKEKAFELCNNMTPIAEKTKAINTLKLDNRGEWFGTNTDVEGFIYPLRKFNLRSKKSTILGSGGAARSAIQGLIDLGMSEINVISRNENSLRKILLDFENQFKINGLLANNSSITKTIGDSNLVVNTTPVGMNVQKFDQQNIPFGENCWKLLHKETIIYDLIYNPKETPLMQLSAKKGCSTIDGSEMLVAQGAKSLSFWTNELEIPIDVMRNSLKQYL